MVRVLKFLGYPSLFFIALVYFFPKESIYYFAEKELKRYDIVMDHEQIHDSGLSLELQEIKVYAKGILGADVSEARFTLLMLYNTVEVQNIVLSEMAKSFVPLKIERVKLSYNIFDPLHVNGVASGEFGELSATISLVERKLFVKLSASKTMEQNYKQTLKELKKSKEGGYVYEQSF